MGRLSPASVRRLIAWSVGPSAPGWGVLLALAYGGFITWTVALIACLVLFIIMAGLILARLADFDRVITYADELLENPDASPPVLETSDTAQRLLGTLLALRKRWAERRDAADDLANTRQEILDSLPDPFFLLDRQRRIIGANTSARRLFELELSGALTRRDLASLIRDPKVLEATDTALLNNRRTEAMFTLPAPVEHSFSALIVPLSRTATDGTAVIIALHDQTERLKMDRMRADFVANASHELRTPLASVLGFIETLQGPAHDDEEAREKFLDIMLKQANRMTRLIDDLLSLSRIELREHTRPTEAIDIETLLYNTVEFLDRQIKERRARVNIDIAADLPAALGDMGELSQVFHNLLSNAVKYGGDAGRVDITAIASETRPPAMPGRGTCIKISVRDYGEGIPCEHIPRLTERFYRIDNARSRALGGTGLGLAIVKHITARHRGALVIESEVGKGATFTVYLPTAA